MPTETQPLDPKTKYLRRLIGKDGTPVMTDIYRVLSAFGPLPSEVDHAIKKLLMPGQRGKGDFRQDIKEARISLQMLEERLDQEEAIAIRTPGVPDVPKDPQSW